MAGPWMFGVVLGGCIGGSVVLLGSLKYGFSPPLLLLGVILVIGFGAVALAGEVVRKGTHLD